MNDIVLLIIYGVVWTLFAFVPALRRRADLRRTGVIWIGQAFLTARILVRVLQPLRAHMPVGTDETLGDIGSILLLCGGIYFCRIGASRNMAAKSPEPTVAEPRG